MSSYLLIASLCLITGLVAGVFLGFLIVILKGEVKRMLLEHAQLAARVTELETNGDYPKRRTHADTRRIEDLQAVADQLRDDAELLSLHHEQDARLERERLDHIRAQLDKLKTRLGETRNSRPDEYPE